MSDTFLLMLADSSLRAAILAALVGLFLAALRVRSAGARHAVWRGVLAAMMLMPILPYGMPEIPFLVSTPLQDMPLPTLATNPPVDRPQVIGIPEYAPSTPEVSVSQASGEQKVWPTVVLVAYGMGTLILVLRLVLGWRAARRIARGGRRIVPPAEDGPVSAWPSDVPLCESGWVTTPVTVGVSRPTTLLPLAWRLWSHEKLRAALTHELAHVRRRDPLVGFLARINLCFFWFHPLAWWLARELAVTAEHASDDSAVRALGEPREYARILVDMAEAVRKSGGRVAWQGIGVDGSGLLARRIDRILRGEFLETLSFLRKAALTATCGGAILVVAASRQQAAPEPLLQSEPQVPDTRAGRELYRAAREMTSQQVADLEASLKRNPEDLETLRKLLIFYWSALGGGRAPGDEKGMATRRELILWLIQNHPDSELAGSVEARIFLTGRDSLVDPVGYAQVRQLWLDHTRRHEVSAVVLGNASRFFEAAEKPLAEELLLRAQAQDPGGPWTRRLASFYALVLVGSYAPTPDYYRPLSVPEPESPYTEAVRRKLARSEDDVLLTALADSLIRSTRGGGADFDYDLLAKSYLERALALNPNSIEARGELLNVLARRRTFRIHELLKNIPPALQYEAVSALPESERFELLPDIAFNAYQEAEGASRFGDPNLNDYIQSARERSKKYAEDLLELARKFRGHTKYALALFKANMTLGSLALQGGDKSVAIDYIRKASRVPATGELVYSRDIAAWLVLTELLREGEREPVIDFLERMARKNVTERDRLREWATEIRNGGMPRFPHCLPASPLAHL